MQWLANALERPFMEKPFTRELYNRYNEALLRLSRWPLTQSMMKINLISWIVQVRIFLGFAEAEYID